MKIGESGSNEAKFWGQFRSAEAILPCSDVDQTLKFFTDQLGFRIESIFPADSPSVAVISGFGLRLRLVRGSEGAPGRLRLICRNPADVGGATELTAPNGTRIELLSDEGPIVVPPTPPSFVVSRLTDDAAWGAGRADMQYRDLVPGRQGGRFIASHIRIPEGGPVPDYVHYHRIRFQMIYCFKGWVRVIYEDQGSSFVMRPGDCVLQPPEIRHRVLECSPGLEVIEVASPAEHETRADYATPLPTETVRRDREFGGQRFVRHEAESASWRPWRAGGFECRETGILEATRGVAAVRVARRSGVAESSLPNREKEDLFLFVLRGSITLWAEGHGEARLSCGDAFVIPAGLAHSLKASSSDMELLEVAFPLHQDSFTS